MSVEFDLSEVAVLAKDIADAPEKVEGLTSKQLTELAAKVRDDARAAAPVDDGDLRNSIHVLGGKDWRKIVAGGGDVDYAFFVEFGTSDTAPQPFMWPAARDADNQMQEMLAEAGVEAITRFR